MGTNGYNPIDDYRFDGSNKLKIAKVDAAGKPFSTGNKADDNARLAEVATRLDALQDVLYAEHRRKLLVVLHPLWAAILFFLRTLPSDRRR